MRYGSNTKFIRNQELVDMYDTYPDWTFENLGEFYGISRARAAYIYHREKKKEDANDQKEGCYPEKER
jgi:hypothetical protein